MKTYYDNDDNLTLKRTAISCILADDSKGAHGKINELKARWKAANCGLCDVEDLEVLYLCLKVVMYEQAKKEHGIALTEECKKEIRCLWPYQTITVPCLEQREVYVHARPAFWAPKGYALVPDPIAIS